MRVQSTTKMRHRLSLYLPIVYIKLDARAICYHIEKKNESISLKITCNTPARILLHPYLARGHQCIRKGTSLYTKFSLYSSLNSLFPVTLVSIDMELWLPSRMMTSTFCRFVWFVMCNGFKGQAIFFTNVYPEKITKHWSHDCSQKVHWFLH